LSPDSPKPRQNGADEDSIPSSLHIDALDIGAYDDPDSRDVFAKARSFELVKLAKAMGMYAFYKALDSNQGPEAVVDGERVIMLGSNNYLGLTRHPRVIAAARDAVEKYGTSMTGSRLMNGTSTIHLELEEKIAGFLDTESALVFSTGYQANLGAISALVNRHAAAVIDKGDHASIYDGTKLSDGEVHRFRHNEPNHLEQTLRRVTQHKAALVVIDGVYSMGGDIAELPSIVDVCKRYHARLMVDEAHAIGVLGKKGTGTAEHFGLQNEVDIQMATFSKSFATIGGFIATNTKVMEYLKHHSRALIFTASPPPAVLGAVDAALDIIKNEPERRVRVMQIGDRMRNGFKRMGYDVGCSQTPIVPLIIGDMDKCFMLWREVTERGLFVNPAVPPAVPPGCSLIRTSYTATHTDEQLDFALGVFRDAGKKLGIIP
jgi:8-amino-7-oxononanoate synthase